MINLEMPVLRVPYTRADNLNKPGGGGSKSPLVSVTHHLREGLGNQLNEALQALPDVVRMEGRTGALLVKLRERAWAKSNRPNNFFEVAGAPVGAVERIGELVIPVTAEKVRDIRQRILAAQSQAEIFAISTIEEFRAWSEDYVFSDPEWHPSVNNIPSGRKLRVELFPWADLPEEIAGMGCVQAAVETLGSKIYYLDPDGFGDVVELAKVPEVRHVELSPQYAVPQDVFPQGIQPVGEHIPPGMLALPPSGPLVGVLDSGVAPGFLDAHVAARSMYEVPPDTDNLHGTFVGGLVVGSHYLSGNDPRFPAESCRLVDVSVLPNGPVDEGLLLARIEDALERHPEVNVWNCSFASDCPNHPAKFGFFAAALDKLSDSHGVLFVIAAGNYSSNPMRGWPAEDGHYPNDGLAMPGEAIRALTVGAVVPHSCHVQSDQPAPYSRRGPGPVFHIKPDVVHYGGGMDSLGQVSGGVRSIIPGDIYAEGVGTSFSTPIVSSIAANAWSAIKDSGGDPNPSLIKALVIQAAALNGGGRDHNDRHYYGHGLPAGSLAALFCKSDTFTLVFEAELQQGVDWAKDDFPMPECLRTPDGKFRGEIVITMCYPSPCDFSFGEEYVQHEVELSFGTYDIDEGSDPPKRKQVGKVPAERPLGIGGWERARLEEGLKYSSTKVFRKRFPRGCDGEQWRLKLSLTRRLEVIDNVTQKVYVIVSMRSLEPDLPVYVDGLAAIPNTWRVGNIVDVASAGVRVRTGN